MVRKAGSRDQICYCLAANLFRVHKGFIDSRDLLGGHTVFSRFLPLWAMVGANCSIFGCSTNRRHTGISIFSLPTGKDESSAKTRDEWVRVITRNREVDKDLRRQINTGTLHVCEKHFEEKFIIKRKYYNVILVIYIVNI